MDKRIKKFSKLLRKEQRSVSSPVAEINQSSPQRDNREELPEKAARCFSENEIDLMAM